MTFASEVEGHLIIPAYWQSAWNAMYNVMTIFGSVVAGYVQDRLGRRAVLLLAAIVATGGIAAAFVANTPAQFLGSKIVTGTAVGLFLTATQTYVSEIAPLPMRGIALSVNTIMLVRVATRDVAPSTLKADNESTRTSGFLLPSLRHLAEWRLWTKWHFVSSLPQVGRFQALSF